VSPPVLKSRGNGNQIAARAQRAAPVSVTVFVLERGNAIILRSDHQDDRLAGRKHLGFFGEGMPRKAWQGRLQATGLGALSLSVPLLYRPAPEPGR